MVTEQQQVTMYDEKEHAVDSAHVPCDQGIDDEGDLVVKGDGYEEYEKGLQFKADGNYSEALVWLNRAADLGNVGAMITLGVMYKKGEEVEQSFEIAINYFRQATKGGSSYGEYKLAEAYKNGEGVKKDLSQALYHYVESADKGYKLSAFQVGMRYYKGEGISQNYAKALTYLKKAADDGMAMPLLATMYTTGQGTEKDNDQALFYADRILDSARESTNQRMVESLEQQAGKVLLIIGVGFEKADAYVKALEIYDKILALNYVDKCSSYCYAAYFAGQIVYNGSGVEKDFSRAVEYVGRGYSEMPEVCEYTTCVNDSVRLWLATMYLIGRGVQKDVKKAFELMEKSYSEGSTDAADMLCKVYTNGYTVERNFNKAIQYCEKGSEKDSCGSNLGFLYYTTHQYEKALGCLKAKSEKTGDDGVERLLSVMYLNGEGMEKDLKIAKEWAIKAASYSKELLDVIDHAVSGEEGRAQWNIEGFYLRGIMGLTVDEEESIFEAFA